MKMTREAILHHLELAETRRELEEARRRLAKMRDDFEECERSLYLKLTDAEAKAEAALAAISAPPGADLVSVAKACARVVEAAERHRDAYVACCTPIPDDVPFAEADKLANSMLRDEVNTRRDMFAAIDALAALRAGKETT